jgi:hypothetical protein
MINLAVKKIVISKFKFNSCCALKWMRKKLKKLNFSKNVNPFIF